MLKSAVAFFSTFLLILFIVGLSIGVADAKVSEAGSGEAAKPPSIREEKATPPKLTMDGFTLQMGIYSPFNDEMKGIYGNAFALGCQYCMSMSRSLDLLASIGFINKSGNPYYDVSTFSSGKTSQIQIIPMEISVRHRIVFMRNPSGSSARGLYSGAGINYIRAKEEIPGMLSAKGGDFGMQIFAGPQMFFRKNLAFEGEVKLLMNNVDMKHQDERYSLTLSGLVIRAALSWYY